MRGTEQGESYSDGQIRLPSETTSGEQASDSPDNKPKPHDRSDDVENMPMVPLKKSGYYADGNICHHEPPDHCLSLHIQIEEQSRTVFIYIPVEYEMEEPRSEESTDGSYYNERRKLPFVESFSHKQEK